MFNEEELFQIGWGSFCEKSDCLTEIIKKDLVHFSGKKGLSINFEFFCQMVEKGRMIVEGKT